MKLIDKDALVAEIDKLIERAKAERILHPGTILAAKNHLLIEDYNKLLSLINNLKVKEVDLEEEFNQYLDNVEGVPHMWHSDEQIEWGKAIAKHFFELRLKAAQKGE